MLAWQGFAHYRGTTSVSSALGMSTAAFLFHVFKYIENIATDRLAVPNDGSACNGSVVWTEKIPQTLGAF